jgi:ubiquitin carboxyl-terminal hydrolase 9/13
VEPVDKNYVRNFFGDKPGLACAYVLFYQETTMEAVLKEQEQEDLAASMDFPIPNEKQHNGVPPSPSLNHFQSTSQLSSPSSEFIRSNGSRPPTAPRLSTQIERTEPEITSPQTSTVHTPPPVPPIPAVHTMPLSPKKSDVQSKKDRARGEKERKIAEKEREKSEKQRRVSNAREYRGHRHEDVPKPTVDTSKPSRSEEDRRNAPNIGNVDSPKKTHHHGFHRFRRSSKSLGHRFGMDKDSRTSTSDLPRTPINEHMASAGVSPPRKSELPDRPSLNHKNGTDAPKEHKHGKWRSFSFRKML